MCTQPKGPMGKSKALKTALYNKLLSSHEHLKKGLFSPTPPVHLDEVVGLASSIAGGTALYRAYRVDVKNVFIG